MTTKRIFMTGASGCIGHYIAQSMIQETEYDLYLLVRNQEKLQFDYKHPCVTILQADMREIDRFRDILETIDVAVLVATAWGGPQEVFEVNVAKTVQLVQLLNPNVCQQAIYFSTASILDSNNQLLQEAYELGTDYIRSKYDCYRELSKLSIAPPITVLFPTLVFGGGDDQPYSHLSADLPEIVKWIDLVRFSQADGSFHFIHGRDIATVVRYLIDYPPTPTPTPTPATVPTPTLKGGTTGTKPACAGYNGRMGEKSPISRQLVLGNEPIAVNEAVAEICQYLEKRIYFRLPLYIWLADLLILLLRAIGVKIEIAPWDKFCMRRRHFTYKDAVNPATLGLPSYCPTLSDVLKISGI
ncbi:MAG: NAD(P)-dependent oxidoreductase [Hormoscilla sp. SP12CHS1]|nr:NAD(P)-dependent oxidoreductase [Hormoscilla sp. SP12CHS1]